MNRNVRDILIAVAALACFGFCLMHQSDYLEDWSQGSGKYTQRVNIPNRETIQLLSLGYDNLYADILTVKAVQMFGAQWSTENNEAEPIYNYFDVLTDLDPYFVDVYELSNIVLSDDYASRRHEITPEESLQANLYSIELLRKGIPYNPDAYRIPYLAMYTAIWNMKDDKLAKSFLPVLKRVPDTPDHIIRLEEYIERQSGRYHIAYDVNLKHFLQYTEQGKEVESGIAWRKFVTIIDGWNKLEMARAADAYRQDTGNHPDSLEQLMELEYLTTYEVASLQSTYDNLEKYLEEPNLSDYTDQIRDASIQTFEGVPEDPNGYWYYIDSFLKSTDEVLADADDPRLSLVDQYSYIISAKRYVDIANQRLAEGQGRIMRYRNETGESPYDYELSTRLSADFMGGHYVYLREVADEEGTVLPRLFSTALLRIITDREPRMGFSGTVDKLPPRPHNLVDGVPEYLNLEPSIWDFEEDVLWALCHGMEPGLRFFEQDREIRIQVTDQDSFINCDDHIDLSILDPNYVPYAGDS